MLQGLSIHRKENVLEIGLQIRRKLVSQLLGRSAKPVCLALGPRTAMLLCLKCNDLWIFCQFLLRIL